MYSSGVLSMDVLVSTGISLFENVLILPLFWDSSIYLDINL